jgi:hypothetical protein
MIWTDVRSVSDNFNAVLWTRVDYAARVPAEGCAVRDWFRYDAGAIAVLREAGRQLSALGVQAVASGAADILRRQLPTTFKRYRLHANCV